MRLTYYLKAAICLCAVAASVLLAAQSPPEREMIALPLHTIEGRLDNGLHYLILPNKVPEHTAEVRLVMRVGSVQEEEHQQGAAHFLEHMAFAGSRHFPGRGMINYWETLGMKFGRDINAFTGFDRTIYMLTLPMDEGDTHALDSTLLALKDWLCGLSLEEERTKKERGVILEELRGYSTGDDFYDLKIGHNRYSERMPLGSADDIRKVDYKELKAFYDKWYAPQLATVMVVGNIRPTETEQRIKALFADIPAKDVTGYRNYPLTYRKDVTVDEIQDTLDSHSMLELMVPHPCIVGNTLESTCRKEQGKLLVYLLGRRFDAQKLSCNVSDSWYLASTNHFVLNFSRHSLEELLSAETRVVAELQSIVRNGFEKEELEDGVHSYVSRLKVDETGSPSSKWCDDFTDYVISGDRYIHSNKEMAQLKALLLKTTNADLQQLLGNWMGFANHSLLVAYRNNILAREKKIARRNKNFARRVKKIARRVKISWRRGRSMKLPAYVYKKPVSDDTTVPAPACLTSIISLDSTAIVGKHYYADLKLTEARLKNGARLLLRPTSGEDNTAYLSAFARGGSGDLKPADFYKYDGAAGFMEMGGIAKVPYDTLTAYMAQEGLSMTLAVSNYWHDVMASAPAGKLPQLFRLIYEKIYDPELRYKDFEDTRRDDLKNLGKETLLSQLMQRASDRQLTNTVDSLMGNALQVAGRPRTRRDVEQLNLDTMATYYKRLFGNPDRLTILVTGRFNVDSVLVEAAAVFSRMRPFGDPTALADAPYRVPYKGYYEKGFSNDNETQTIFDYLLAGNYTPSLKNSLSLKLMRDLLQNRLLTVLREQENIVYSPYVSLFYDGIPQKRFYFDLSASVENVNMGRADRLVHGIIEDLQAKPVPKEELESLKRSFIVTKRQVLTDEAPTEWRSTLTTLLKNGESLSDFDRYNACLDSITPDYILTLFRRLVKPENAALLYIGNYNKK